MSNEDELERNHIWDRRIRERELYSSSKECNGFFFLLKINDEIVNSTKFCGVYRLGKSKQTRSLKKTLKTELFKLFCSQKHHKLIAILRRQ